MINELKRVASHKREIKEIKLVDKGYGFAEVTIIVADRKLNLYFYSGEQIDIMKLKDCFIDEYNVTLEKGRKYKIVNKLNDKEFVSRFYPGKDYSLSRYFIRGYEQEYSLGDFILAQPDNGTWESRYNISIDHNTIIEDITDNKEEMEIFKQNLINAGLTVT